MFRPIEGKDIYGLRTVNCGEICEFDACDPINPMRSLILEVLRPEKHNPHAQIICYYLWDTDKCTKIELTIYRRDDGTIGSEIYHFKNRNELQHHKSSNYENFIKLPKKYVKIIEYLKPYFIEVFGE